MANTNFLNITKTVSLSDEFVLGREYPTKEAMADAIAENTVESVNVNGLQVFSKCPAWFNDVKIVSNIWVRVCEFKIPADIVFAELDGILTKKEIMDNLKSFCDAEEPNLADATYMMNIKWTEENGQVSWEFIPKK